MPHFFLALTVSLLVLATGHSSTAQDPVRSLPEPQVVPGFPSRPLLEEPVVQREIGLSEKQKTNLLLLEEEHQANRGAVGEGLGDEGFDFNAMLNQTDEADRLHRAARAKILSGTQKNRLLQLEWQREGWPALTRPDLGARVNLRPAQAARIREIVDLMRRDSALAGLAVPIEHQPDPKVAAALKQLNPANGFLGDPELVVPGGGPMQGSRTATQLRQTQDRSDQVRQVAMNEVARLLEPEQRATYDRVLGPPFNFKRLDHASLPIKPPSATSRSTKGRPKAQ